MSELFWMGMLYGSAFIIPAMKLPTLVKQFMANHAFIFDVAVGAIMVSLLAGTQGGMVMATVATLAWSAYLVLLKFI